MNYQELITQHQKDIERLNYQRRWWLYASSIVFSGIIGIIFGWDWISGLDSKPIWWVIVSLMLLISVNWWYWTMRVIRILIRYQEVEYALLQEILHDVNYFKQNLKDFHDQTIDMLK